MTALGGDLLVFEGPDQVGKTSVSRATAAALAAVGVSVEWRSFPGATPSSLGELVYRVHHDPHSVGVGSVSPLALQCLHVAAHLDAIEQDIGPLILNGTTIVLDRYWWSTWVYGRAAGVPEDVLHLLVSAERAQWGDIVPKRVFLLSRSGNPAQSPRLSVLYSELAHKWAAHAPVEHIPNDGPLEEAVSRVMQSCGHKWPRARSGGRESGPAAQRQTS